MFEKYLAEAKKVYEFNIGICGDLPENFADTLEGAMQKFSVKSMSNGKKTPIQERPLDFPTKENCEVTYYEVAVNYPTTPQVLHEYISQMCACDRDMIVVRNMNEPAELYQEIKDEDTYVSKLDTLEMEQADPKAQDKVGTNRVMDLLKELEDTRKEKDNDPIADVKPVSFIDSPLVDYRYGVILLFFMG